MSKRVLIVDDAYFMRTLIKKVLKEAGYEIVDEAKNGKEGITKYFELKPDFVTMDINMPDITGIEATRQILSKDPNAKIIAVTGSDSDEIKAEMISAGAKAYLKKPFQPAFLLSKIDDMFAKKEKTVLELINPSNGDTNSLSKTDVEEDFFEKKELQLLDKPNQTREELIVIKNNEDHIEFPVEFGTQDRDKFTLTKDALLEEVFEIEPSDGEITLSVNVDSSEKEVQEIILNNPIHRVEIEETDEKKTESVVFTPPTVITTTPSPNPSHQKEEVNSYMQIRPPRGRGIPRPDHDRHESMEDLIEPVINDVDGGISIPTPKKGFLSKIKSIFTKK
jgi:CheY-like chemotaxis protein